MSRSIYWSMLRIALTSFLLSINTNTPLGMPAEYAAFVRISNSVLFVLDASLPPLNMTALPDLRHNDIICGTTSGRDSNIVPIIPIGHEI